MTPAEIAAQAAELRPFATESETRILDAIEAHGSGSAAARALGMDRANIRRALRSLGRRAARRGWAPAHDMTKTAPEPFVLKGTSTLYDADGKVKLQWVKTCQDADLREKMLRESARAMAETLPRLPATPAPGGLAADLCNLYVMTDCHMGLLAWHREGGNDWDISIAEQTIGRAFETMIASAPPAETAVIGQLGDFLHSDGMLPVTPQSHHVLDQDSRFAKVVATAIRTLRRIIDAALAKHARIVVLLAEGNHDMASSIWLRAMFAALYEAEPRVEVINTPLPYYAVQHGNTMLAFHHGHMKKMGDLPLLLAAQFPAMWGATTKRYVHTGHLHHAHEREFSGMKVVQHPTLAARDAYSARGGWISERQAAAITYSAQHGEVGRTIVTPEMLY